MVVTDIKKQVRRQHRYSIYLDSSYAFSLTEQQVQEKRIRIGVDLSPSTVVDLKRASQEGLTYERVLNYIAIRERSKKELRDYFKRKKLSEEEQETLIARLSASGFIDDRRFACGWVAQRRKMKHASTRRIRYELKAKGVSNSDISFALEKSDLQDEDTIKQLIEKKSRLSRYADQEKLLRYIVSVGYNYYEAKKALEDWLSETANRND